ncbi:MAG: carboxypeptidase-like regulatory domain-containing protein [Bryobacteraceae bacterium]|nr:carboxypeptidase-like regulatory domain-containing protein [Bryobacteraceae bacterium]
MNLLNRTAAVLCCLVVSLGAQSIVGRISGTVTDASAGTVPGAIVVLTNEATRVPREMKTDENGFYVATALPVGYYEVAVEQPGFRKALRTGNNLVADGRLTVNFKLEVGEVSSSVQVEEATGEQVNTVSGEVGRVIDSEQVQNLALNGRNYMQLVSLVPGTVLLDEDQMALTTSLSITAQSVNGNRGNTNYLSVDGGSNMDSGSNGSQINNVGVDFIREVSIRTSAFSAESGRNSGSSINVVTRGGSNKYSGTVFEFLRNDKLDAKQYFAPIKPPLRFNDFGWNLGGPLVKGKVFFFAGQEYKYIRRFTDPTRRTLPTRAERAGDFSGRTGNLFYPGTTEPVPDKNIASLMTTDGKAIAAAYTAMEKLAASYVDRPTGNNATYQISNPFAWRQDIARVDYNLSTKHQVYFRYLHDMYDLIEPYGTFFSSNLPMTPTTRSRPGYGIQLSHTWLASPRIVNEAKINTSWNGQRIPMVGDAWKRSTYGMTYPQVFQGGGIYDADGLPNIDVNGFANLRGPNAALASPTTDIQAIENVTLINGRHTTKMGFTVIRNRKDQNGRPEYPGYVNFSNSGNNRTTNNSLADAFLGNFRTYRESSADPMGFFRFTSYEGYVSDQWRIMPRLSMEIGVRYQRNSPTYTQGNNITNFVPGLYDPRQAVTVTPAGVIVAGSGNVFNGLIRAGDSVPEDQIGRVPGATSSVFGKIPGGAPRGLYDVQNLFAPRFSFSYAPFRSSKTAIQGGFGLFYDKPEGNLIFPMVNYAPWLTSVNFENGNLANPTGGTAAALAPMGNIDAINPNLKTPYSMNFSFGIQQQLPSAVFFEVKYVGNNGRHLIRQPDINQVPFDTLRAIRAIPSAQRPSDNSMRPYLGYSSIRQRLSDSTSNYHSLQVYATRRKGRLLFTSSYTWSKVLTDSSGNGDNPENPYNRHYNYGPASFDRSHVISTTVSYVIPTPKYRNPFLKQTIMGWEYSGITRYQTGAPLTITANTSIGGRRADYLGGDVLAPIDERGPNNWLNKAAFGPAPNDELGNLGVGRLRGPGLFLLDSSLRKVFRMSKDGQRRLQFQAEFFNVLNHVNFRNPNTNFTDVNFATISTAGPQRNVQMGLKYYF